MPTYVYRREDGTTFEISQRITEDALTTCPDTGQPVIRVISGGTGLIFKGSGFYLTDYARKSEASGNGTTNSNTSKEDTTTETKSAPAETKSTPAAPKDSE